MYDLEQLHRMLDTNPDYLRDLYRRAIFSSTFSSYTGLFDLDQEGYYTTDFMMPDSRDAFKRNLEDPEAFKQLIKYGWATEEGAIGKPIEYRINKDGFRTKHFDQGDRPIVCFGCSYTYGVGLPEEFTWPHLVSTHYDIPAYNLGIPGNGLDIIAFYVSKWLRTEIWRPRAFCILIPPPGRIEFLKLEFPTSPPPNIYVIRNLLHALMDAPPSAMVDFLADSIPMTSYINQYKNIQLIKLLANYLSIPCIIGNSQNCVPPQDPKDPSAHYARDLMHPGLQWQTAVANYMIGELDKIPPVNKKTWNAYD